MSHKITVCLSHERETLSERFLGGEQIEYEVSGKPYCTSAHISISHSGGVCALAIADFPIGVDIERVGAARARVAERLFSDAEKKMDFFTVWTRKEARFKLFGCGSLRDDTSCDGLFYHTRRIGEYTLTVCAQSDFEICIKDEVIWEKP